MNKVLHGVIAGVFGVGGAFLWWMLTCVSTVMDRLPVPAFTSFCVSLRPVLWVLPVLAAGYCGYVWFSRNDARKSWVGFFAGTMMALIPGP